MTLRLLLPPSVGAARARARAELLDQSLRADLAEAMEVDVAADYADLAARAGAGTADLVWMPPTVCAQLESQMRALYKCIRQGRSHYRSAIVGRKGELWSLEDLRGRHAAWVDRLSVAGYLLAADLMRRSGIDPDRDLGGQRFLGSYPEALTEVLEGRADFAAITVRDESPATLRSALATHGGRRAADELATLRVTRACPNDAMAITQGLAPAQAEKLDRRVFQRDDTRSRAALCLALDADGFERARPGEYGALRDMLLEAR
ncbi:MAG TPA: PhnD/SsuA/transferrin family substrate-binding protein [Sandaracinaceae bacterium LLY-WYZ-13_1]|nr:PhnD/SsuA/transferrin family substrate-binding protein [Sandaracinaceae bacterium LLY-WYZ-13_1]